jgi:hypothetical protein
LLPWTNLKTELLNYWTNIRIKNKPHALFSTNWRRLWSIWFQNKIN